MREAYALALAQAVPGPAGDEARQLVKEWRARMELVGRGLDQVRASLHGSDSGATEGLRHCLSRLEELAKVQADHEEIPALRAALQAELTAVSSCESSLTALARSKFGEALWGRRRCLADDVREPFARRLSEAVPGWPPRRQKLDELVGSHGGQNVDLHG